MTSEAMVVMEQGSRWPGWIDEQNGHDSSVWVLAQGRAEPYGGFAVRALESVRAIVRGSTARHALVVCNGEGGRRELASRRTLLRTLLYELSVAGGGEVVVVLDGAAAHRRELCGVVSELAEELDGDDQLTLRVRALPSQPPPALRQVA